MLRHTDPDDEDEKISTNMMDESWQDTIQPLFAAPINELTIEFGVRLLDEREDELEECY
jgi:hypothetical protein